MHKSLKLALVLGMAALIPTIPSCKAKDDAEAEAKPTEAPAADPTAEPTESPAENSVTAVDLSEESAMGTLQLVLPYNTVSQGYHLSDEGPCDFGTLECHIKAMFGDPDAFGAGSAYNGFALTDMVGMPHMKTCARPLSASEAELVVPGSDFRSSYACAAFPTGAEVGAAMTAKFPDIGEQADYFATRFKVAVAWGKEDDITRFLTSFSITPPAQLLGGDEKDESASYAVINDAGSKDVEAFGVTGGGTLGGMRTSLKGNAETKKFQLSRVQMDSEGRVAQFKILGLSSGEGAHYLVKVKLGGNATYTLGGTQVPVDTETSVCMVAATGEPAADLTPCAAYEEEIALASYIDVDALPSGKFEPAFENLP